MALRIWLGVSIGLALLLGSPVLADDAPQPAVAQPAASPAPANAGANIGSSTAERRANGQGRAARNDAQPASGAEPRRLPDDSRTKQTVALPGRTLSFTAIAGSIRLFDDNNEPEADMAYTAYELDGGDVEKRPVTFVFNGGPGASSAWLQLGNFGPWRINMAGEGLSSSATPDLLPNAETWLDFTDLVFIDPVGTGYSRLATTNEEVKKRIYSVDGDARSIALMIRRWLEKSGRLMSPKYLVGESYGGIRGPKIVRDLQSREGVGVRGLILVSPVLDLRTFSGPSLMQYVIDLPTMAAVVRQSRGPVVRKDMADVERYAAGDFLVDLVKGEQDADATTRIVDQVSTLTGISRDVVARLAGRMTALEFRREFDRRDGHVTGRYDATVLGADPYPDSSFYRFGDPSLDPLIAPFTSAAVDLTTRRLNWHPDGSYQVLSEAVERAWDWGKAFTPPESVTQVRQMLATDPNMKLLITHGLFDLAAPYFGSKIILDQLPAYAAPPRARLVVYPGGHMFYSREASRKALRSEAEAMIGGAPAQ